MFEIGDKVCCICGEDRCPRGRVIGILDNTLIIWDNNKGRQRELGISGARLWFESGVVFNNYVTRRPKNLPDIGGV